MRGVLVGDAVGTAVVGGVGDLVGTLVGGTRVFEKNQTAPWSVLSFTPPMIIVEAVASNAQSLNPGDPVPPVGTILTLNV
jgi:hypothetical protein